jgi:hypothetical protein
MLRSVLLGVVLAGVLAGCSLGSGQHALSGPPSKVTTADGIVPAPPLAVTVARRVEGMRIPPRNSAPLTQVVCQISGRVAVCTGRESNGRKVTAEFRIHDTGTMSGTLTPVCASPVGNAGAVRNIFCAE